VSGEQRVADAAARLEAVHQMKYRVAYVGAGLSGRSSSLSGVLTQLGVPNKKYLVAGQHHKVTAEVDERDVGLVLGANRIRGWLAYSDPRADSLDPRIVEELDLLPRYDGFIFVVDSRDFRMEANVWAFKSLSIDLESRGSSLDDKPVVFQVNFRDQPAVVSMETIRAQFSTRHCAYTESVASEGIGLLESIRSIVRLLNERSP
jgi:hypothetical protein